MTKRLMEQMKMPADQAEQMKLDLVSVSNGTTVAGGMPATRGDPL